MEQQTPLGWAFSTLGSEMVVSLGRPQGDLPRVLDIEKIAVKVSELIGDA